MGNYRQDHTITAFGVEKLIRLACCRRAGDPITIGSILSSSWFARSVVIRIGFRALSTSALVVTAVLVAASLASPTLDRALRSAGISLPELGLSYRCDHAVAAELPKEFPVKTKSPAMDRVKELAGSWVGKDEDGQDAFLSYVVTSGGTSVLETLTPGVHPPMLTVYHEDGDSIMATHYCNMNNQPRMRLKEFDAAAGKMFFDFVDITNLKSPEGGHIRDLTLTITDQKHLVQEWTYTNNGKSSKAIFRFERKAVKETAQK